MTKAWWDHSDPGCFLIVTLLSFTSIEIICGSRQTENREICELFREAAVCGILGAAAFVLQSNTGIAIVKSRKSIFNT